MMSGGKIEPNEDAVIALALGLREEIGCAPAAAAYIGRFRAAAANEPGRDVIADVYAVRIESEPSAKS
jgi:hypothetical protein